MRALPLTHVQLDELRLKQRGATEAAWLWVACDARTKIIPAFALGPRTQAKAHQLVHEVAQRLAPDCLPIFSSVGLPLYFYALTAHFRECVQPRGKHVFAASTRQLSAHLSRLCRSTGFPELSTVLRRATNYPPRSIVRPSAVDRLGIAESDLRVLHFSRAAGACFETPMTGSGAILNWLATVPVHEDGIYAVGWAAPPPIAPTAPEH